VFIMSWSASATAENKLPSAMMPAYKIFI